MIAFDNHRMTAPHELEAVVGRAAAGNIVQLPAVQAAADGLIDLTFLRNPARRLPKHVLDLARPHLVIVADDPPEGFGMSLGPCGWRCMERIRAFQPRAAICHGSGGSRTEYLIAAEGALLHGRLLLVECSSAYAPIWGRALEGLCPTAVLLPCDGIHPVAETRH